MGRKGAPAEARKQLLRLAEELGSVAEACRITGFSRDSYYRFRREDQKGGAQSGATPRAIAHVLPKIEQAVLDLARTSPQFGRLMVSKLLYRQGLDITPSGVRQIWLRWDLETPVKRKKKKIQSLPTCPPA